MKLLPALAVVIFVVCAGLAAATLLRPAGGYEAAVPLIRAMLLGSGAGALVLLGLALGIVVASARRELSVPAIGRAAASLPALGSAVIVATLVIIAIEVWPSGASHPADAVHQATFARWQGTIVPLTVSFGHLLQTLAAAQRKPGSRRLSAAARRAPSRLRHLESAVGVELTRERNSPELRSITSQLAVAIRYAAASAADLNPPAPISRPSRGSGTAALRRRFRDAKTQLVLAAQATQSFTLRANALGGRLSAAGHGAG